MLNALGAALGPALGQAIGGLSGSQAYQPVEEDSRMQRPSGGGRGSLLALLPGNFVSILGLLGLAGWVGNEAQKGTLSVQGTTSKVVSPFTPVCPEVRFGYSYFGAEVSGMISATMAGWEASVTCEGDNVYTGPPVACKRTWIRILHFRIEQYLFVSKEDLYKDTPRPLNPMLLSCRRPGASAEPSASNSYNSWSSRASSLFDDVENGRYLSEASNESAAFGSAELANANATLQLPSTVWVEPSLPLRIPLERHEMVQPWERLKIGQEPLVLGASVSMAGAGAQLAEDEVFV